jgi:adenylate cyclase
MADGTNPDGRPEQMPDEARRSHFTREQLERVILGEQPILTSTDVASAAGVTVEQARRLWRALGFPDAGEQPAFSDADLAALSTLIGTVEVGAIDFDTAVRMTRAVGQTMARLADWQVATLAPRVEELEAGPEATGSRIGSAMRLADQVGTPFEKLLIYSWRRHLAAAVSRVEALGAADEDLHTTQVTVGFADLVSFTALSNEIDDNCCSCPRTRSRRSTSPSTSWGSSATTAGSPTYAWGWRPGR